MCGEHPPRRMIAAATPRRRPARPYYWGVAERTQEAERGRVAGPETEGPDLGPRTVSYPYRRIQRPAATPTDGPDPYGNPDPAWLQIDWGQHLRTVEVMGSTINYAEIGAGPAVVLVHGLGGSWQNWLENLPHLARSGYRAIALDLPGFGRSPLPPWELNMPAYGRLLDQFCVQLGLDRAAVVGNSMGGFIAAETAIAAPNWIERLVLVSAAGVSHATMRREPVMVAGRMLNLLNPIALHANTKGLRRPGIRQLSFQGVFRHPQRIRRELLYEFSAHAIGTPGFLPALGALTGYDLLHRLPRVEVPVLLIWGRDDLVVPASDAVGYHQRLADSRIEIFDDCGHVPMAERPVRFNRLLDQFLSAADPR